jgi:hypothetical protein
LILAGALAAGAAAVLAILREREMRGPGVLLELLSPETATFDPNSWVALFQSLHGIARQPWKRRLFGEYWLSFEYWSDQGTVGARCWCPAQIEGLVRAHLLETVPRLEVRPCQTPNELGFPAVRNRLQLAREALYPLGTGKPDALSRVIGILSRAESGVLQVVISPDVYWESRAQRRLDQLAGNPVPPSVPLRLLSGLSGLLFSLIWSGSPDASTSERKLSRRHQASLPPREKADQPAWRVEIRLRAAAAGGRAELQMQSLVSAFRSLDGANTLRPGRVLVGPWFDRDVRDRRPPRQRDMVMVASELAALFHVPCPGSALETAPVRILPGRQAAQRDKVIGLAEDGSGTEIGIAQADSRQHMAIHGPTGSGKSTLLLNLALDDIHAGRGVGVVDPKGDLVQAVLERIPTSEWDRVVLIDPAQRERPVGFNVLDCPDPELHEVICDHVVTIFKKTYERFWGPRTDDLLRAAILTLLQRPDTTLCEVPLLLLQPEVRRTFINLLDDPVGLEPFWREFGAMSEAQRVQVVAPLLNKLRTFLLRRTVRNMLGQSRSSIDMAEVLDKQYILLISLAKGLLGEETSQLLGSFLVARIWQTATARAGRPEGRRADFNLYVDEFQNYLHLPQNLEDVLAESRGYRLGLVLANQHLGQLSASTQEALASNARSRIVFQCGQDDARYLAREFGPQLGEHELRNLQRFQIAARLCVNGRSEPPITAITRSARPGFGPEHAARLMQRSLERWGRARSVVEAEIRARLVAEGFTPPDPPLGG